LAQAGKVAPVYKIGAHVQDEKSNQRHRDLNAHCVLRAPDEMGDHEHLLHQPEEQFDLPAPLEKISDLLGRGRC
jgi:hypothetical protein